jgi:predicted O-methyltransferase YrrM
MDQTIRSFLRQMEESGRVHDEAEREHSKKFLNLEPETAEVLVLLLTIARVRRLLEIGTSNGYSTIWIAATLGAVGGRIISIERSAEKHRQAQDNMTRLGLSQFVDLRLGDATEIVASLTGPFDCVFYDADRVSAPQQLDLLLPKLSPRALLLADNALSHPEQISGYLASIARLDRTVHMVLNVGKGLSVAFRDWDSHDLP